ncbi:trypsin-like peptidase domain-containing protein [Streptomyces sp. NPDC050433]|uniref:trypsin-like peptidase domain-containing protein n=1 Tax=Streptomyces sp. NPDC050433 TaxID=3365615 RepID=UPI0037AE336F
MTGAPLLALVPSRVARVFMSPSNFAADRADITLGSGYRISDRLVLTANHVVAGDGALLVDFDGDSGDRHAVERVWQDCRTDVALLRYVDPPTSTVAPVGLGRVDRTRVGKVTADSLGHPVHARVMDEFTGIEHREMQQVSGRVLTASRERPGVLSMELDSTPAPAADGDSPWKGMSGAALVARESGLVLGVFRDHLPASGVSTHAVAELAAIDDPEWDRLLREEGVRPDFRPAPHDGWDTSDNHLTLHHRHERKLADKGSVFTQHALPFVDPGPEHPASPRNILDTLVGLADEIPPKIGAVLTGPPGTGKTRLCLETARLADLEGWLVVHLDDEVSLQTAWSCVHPYGRRILLVVPDIGSLAELVTAQIDELLRSAKAKGIKLAVLIAARTSAWARRRKPSDFRAIAAPADRAHYEAVRRKAVRVLARTAVEQIGERRTMRLCGGPPAFALHLALQRGRQADRGENLARAVPLNTEDMTGWLIAVLDAEKLSAPEFVQRGLVEKEEAVPPDRIAATRIAAATPCQRDVLKLIITEGDITETALAHAEELIKSLEHKSLVEAHSGEVRMVHDLYTDQILARFLLMRDERTPRDDVLWKVLNCGLTSPHVLGNVLRAVDRLHEALGEAESQGLVDAVVRWFEEKEGSNAATAGQLIAADPRGRALLTLLRGNSWQPLVQRFPERIAEPWLRTNYTQPVARHALMAVRSYLDASHGLAYLMGWIDKNAVLPQAAFVFHRALPGADADSAFSEWTVDGMYEYLTQNWHRIEASRVYDRLFDDAKGLALRPGDRRVAQVVDWALAWLRNHPQRSEAGFFAPQLLLRPELKGRPLADTARLLLDTVVPRDLRSASYSLEPLLKRQRLHKDLPRPLFKQAVKDSLAWLEDERLGQRPEAAYVLGELLRRDLPGRDDTPRAAQCGLRWLDAAATHPDAWRVLSPLLTKARKPDARAEAMLTDDECVELADHAVAWLDGPGAEHHSQISLLGTLLRARLLDGDEDVLHRLADTALRLYNGSPDPTVARSLLVPLLSKRSLRAKNKGLVLDAAFDYLKRHPRNVHTSHPLTGLVTRTDLDERQFRDAMTATLGWIDAHPRDDSAFVLLARALNSPLAGAADRGRLAGRLIEVLSVELLSTDARHKLTQCLLGHRDEIVPEWNRFVARACRVLADAGLPEYALPVLNRMLKGTDRLDLLTLDDLYATCSAWCDTRPLFSADAVLLIRTVLTSRPISPAARRGTSVAACRLLNAESAGRRGSGWLLLDLLRHGDLSGGPDGGSGFENAWRTSLDWLDAWPGHQLVLPLLEEVTRGLRRYGAKAAGPRPEAAADGATADMAERAMRHWETWLAGNPDADATERAAAESHRRQLRALAHE